MTAEGSIKLSIVFLNHNRLHESRCTVEHLRELAARREDLEVIAVDNGSSDGTGPYLAQEAGWLKPLLLDENLGIGGYNEGFAAAIGQYILVLDDDSHPADEATLDRLIARLDGEPAIGVIACRIESTSGEWVPSWHVPQDGRAGPSMAFVGCGFAIRRDLFARVGWYDARFFLYQNELELAVQVRLQGYRIEYEPLCRVVHRSTGARRNNWRRVFFPTRNTLWLIRRYCPFPLAAYLVLSRLLIGLFRAVQLGELRCYVRAVREGLAEPMISIDLPRELRSELAPFWRQNSLWHHLIGQS